MATAFCFFLPLLILLLVGVNDETEEQFGKRLKAASDYVNANYDVDGLCQAMPRRMHELVHKTRGGRLKS